MKNKKGAMELSMTTIVIVVLSLTLLIMGFVLIRNIMCGAVNITSDINDQVRKEVNNLFATSGGEVQCIGSGDPVTMVADRTNYIYCSVQAPEEARYNFNLKINEGFSDVPKEQLRQWFTSGEQELRIGPGDREPKKVGRVKLPSNAPEKEISFDLEVTKDSDTSPIYSQSLSYRITQQGIIGRTLC